MNLAMICAKIGLDLSKVEKNTKKHAIFCSILTFLLIFQFQQNFSAKHCKINISYTFLVLLTPLSPLYLLKQWQKKNKDISVSVPEQAREFEFFGFQRDHMGTEVLESKSIVKRAENLQKHLNFRSFLSLAALKSDGRARNSKFYVQWLMPNDLIPISTWQLCQQWKYLQFCVFFGHIWHTMPPGGRYLHSWIKPN